MKTMRIGFSIINLDAVYDINCVECDEGTNVCIEYPHAVKEYLVPDFFVPETVAAAIQKGMNDADNFNLMAKLQALNCICAEV